MMELRPYPTVVHMLRETAARWPEREAVVCGDERLNYANYLDAIATFAGELVSLGARGERVALVLGNGPDICVAIFATHAAGAQAVPLNPLYTSRELGVILEDAEPRIVVCEASVVATLEPILARCGNPHVIPVGERGHRRLTTARPGAALPEPLPSPADLATLQYTGGTTGVPKGVDCPHSAIAVNIAQRDALVPTDRDGERILCVMPLYHTYAVAMCLHNAANCGGTLVVLPRFTTATGARDIAARADHSARGRAVAVRRVDERSGICAGGVQYLAFDLFRLGPVARSIAASVRDATGAPVLEGYGQSESGPVLTFNPRHGLRKLQSVGIPVPQTELQIVDALNGERVLGTGEVGEIRVRGPQIMIGYRKRPAETADALRGHWLYTGDLGELDEDGYLFIRDRKKAMLLVSGFNVYPRELEEVLCQHAAVAEAAVIGVPDQRSGSRIKAYVVARAGAAARRLHARATLPR